MGHGNLLFDEVSFYPGPKDWTEVIGVGLTINQSNESAMHKTLTALSGIVTCVTRRAATNICWSVLAHLLLAGFLFSQPVSAAPVHGVQEIAEDNAVISSPQTTINTEIRLGLFFRQIPVGFWALLYFGGYYG